MKIPVMKAAALSRANIEHIAQKVLRDFYPDAQKELIQLDVEEMFEQYIPKRLGITTEYEELSFNIHGYTEPSKLRSVVALNLVESDDRATIRFGRSTIGHEIGHSVLHAHQFKRKRAELKFLHDKSHENPILFRQEDLKPFENPEWQAWEFCKALFLPAHLIQDAIESGVTIREIADKVNLNPAFVEVRLKNLKLN